jgi:hypothetical protein
MHWPTRSAENTINQQGGVSTQDRLTATAAAEVGPLSPSLSRNACNRGGS